MALLSLAVASSLLVNSANSTTMIISAPLIDRLGFEEFAFNLFLNYGVLVDGYKYEQDNASMVVSAIGDSFNIAIRCYHPDRGWLSVEFTHKQ